MRRLSYLLLFSLVVLATACDSSEDADDTPQPNVPTTPPPSADQNMLRWSIGSTDYATTEFGSNGASFSTATGIFTLSGVGLVDGTIANSAALAFVVTGVSGTGTYTMPQPDLTEFGAIALANLASQTDVRYEATALTLVLTALTDEGVAGTFTMTVVNENDPGDTLRVTNGQFSLVFE